jgi:hypothetical protein
MHLSPAGEVHFGVRREHTNESAPILRTSERADVEAEDDA